MKGRQAAGTLYKALYLGPSRYQGTEDDEEGLRKALQELLRMESRNPSIVKVEISYLLGLFTIWTNTKDAAYGLPFFVAGYERSYEVVAVEA